MRTAKYKKKSFFKIRLPRKKDIFGAVYALFGQIAPNISRNLLLSIATLGIIGWAVYSNYTIEHLKSFSSTATHTYAQLISEAFYDKIGSSLEHATLEQIIRDFDMPIIITDMMGRPLIWKNVTQKKYFFFKTKIPQENYPPETFLYLKKEMDKLKKNYTPKLIYGRDRKTSMGFLYYGDSELISGMSLLPYVEIFFVLSFTSIVYLISRAFLITEQSNLWIGLAKETAHQLGTPLTSLVGWIEYLQVECENLGNENNDFLFSGNEGETTDFSKQVYQISNDMSRDVARIKKVTDRFSYIGSKPLLEKKNLKPIIDEHIEYFSKRLPKEGKKITIEYDCREELPVVINSDLISWVLENLFKNSLDAIDAMHGEISLRAIYVKVDKKIRITHRDNGRGIPKEQRDSVFSPGFTTKKRGWGLGLTLAKRIIEEYHGGKIFISWSQIKKGTEFVIELPAADREKS